MHATKFPTFSESMYYNVHSPCTLLFPPLSLIWSNDKRFLPQCACITITIGQPILYIIVTIQYNTIGQPKVTRELY